jgi:hypothetical protein
MIQENIEIRNYPMNRPLHNCNRTKEGGLFELSKNDDLIAAPGAASKMNSGGGSTVVQQDNSETNSLLKQLISTNQEGNYLQKKKPELSPVGLYEVQ